MKTKTWLPIFPGFYNTIFEPDNEDTEIDDINQQRTEKGWKEIDYDDCEWNYNEYFKKVAEQCTDIIAEQLQAYVNKIEHEGLYSPREYNFHNDSINIIVTLGKEHILFINNYLKLHTEAFGEYLRGCYTSGSGFISFHSADPPEWTEWATDEHKLGSVLQFILENEGFGEMDLFEEIQDGYIFAVNYTELTESEVIDV